MVAATVDQNTVPLEARPVERLRDGEREGSRVFAALLVAHKLKSVFDPAAACI